VQTDQREISPVVSAVLLGCEVAENAVYGSLPEVHDSGLLCRVLGWQSGLVFRKPPSLDCACSCPLHDCLVEHVEATVCGVGLVKWLDVSYLRVQMWKVLPRVVLGFSKTLSLTSCDVNEVEMGFYSFDVCSISNADLLVWPYPSLACPGVVHDLYCAL